jgi:hypothetical protein
MAACLSFTEGFSTTPFHHADFEVKPITALRGADQAPAFARGKSLVMAFAIEFRMDRWGAVTLRLTEQRRP